MKPGDLVRVTGNVARDPSRLLPEVSSIGLRRSFVKSVNEDDLGTVRSGFSGFAALGSPAIVVAARQYVDRWRGPDGETCTRVKLDLLLVAAGGIGWVIEENVAGEAAL